MAFTVSTFKSNLAKNGGAARPNLFKVKIEHANKTTLSFSTAEVLLVKAAQIPAGTIASLPVNFVGRPIKYTGFRTYDNWVTTVINDESFTARDKITQWMREISGKMDGSRTENFGAYADDDGVFNEGTATVTQVNKNGADGRTYKIKNLWPTNLGTIGLDWSSDTMEEYTVEWCFDTWEHVLSTDEAALITKEKKVISEASP